MNKTMTGRRIGATAIAALLGWVIVLGSQASAEAMPPPDDGASSTTAPADPKPGEHQAQRPVPAPTSTHFLPCNSLWRIDGTYLDERFSPWFYSRDGFNIRFKETSGYYYSRWVASGNTCVKQTLIDRRADYYQYTSCYIVCQMSDWTSYTSTTLGPHLGQPNYNQQYYGWDPDAKVFKVG